MNPKIQLYCPDIKPFYRTLGVDAKLTGTGIVVVGNGDIVYHKNIKSKKFGVPRLLEIETAVDIVIKEYAVDEVVIEDYAFSRGFQAHQMGELGGILRRIYHLAQVPWKVVGTNQLKQFASGKGGTDKNLLLREVFKRWGVELPDDDQNDAFVLAIIGQALAKAARVPEFMSQLPQFQIDVLMKLMGLVPPKAKKKAITGV